MTTDENKNDRVRGSFSTVLTLHDIVVTLIAILAIASAFFMYDTRITVLETKQETDSLVCTYCQSQVNDMIPRLIQVEGDLGRVTTLVLERGDSIIPILQADHERIKDLELEIRDIKRRLKK